MFPLGTVLVPHQVLPLHVFEPRYRTMVRDCLAGDGVFGVVLIERGSEVGGGDARFGTGTTARIVQADEERDGRWLVQATGGERLRVVEWLPDDPYPQAEVEVVADAPWDAAADDAFALAVAGFKRVVDLVERLGGTVDRRLLELPGDPEWDHWLLIDRAPIGDLDRLALLSADSPSARLTELTDHLAATEAVLASRLGGG